MAAARDRVGQREGRQGETHEGGHYLSFHTSSGQLVDIVYLTSLDTDQLYAVLILASLPACLSSLAYWCFQVMEERQNQIEVRMEENRQQQEASLERREELLRDLELANQLTRREDEKRDAERTARRQELEAQVRLIYLFVDLFLKIVYLLYASYSQSGKKTHLWTILHNSD